MNPNMNLNQSILASAVLAACTCMTNSALAEEGGSGHYMPGSMASFIDTVPAAPGFMLRLNVLNYQGSVGPTVQLPFAGMVATGADVGVAGYGLTMVYRPVMSLPDGWSYSMSATIPLVKVDVAAMASSKGVAVRTQDSETGLGDLVLQPLMLAYQHNPDFATNFRLTAYAPTGDYTKGKLANTGKNFWSFEPTINFLYFGKKDGIEVNLFAGITFNNENEATAYKSGTQLHMESTVAQHFPLWGGLAGAGLTGFYYKQINGDSGDGATFGDFKAKSVGIGPTASFITKVGEHNVSAELKWLHETDVNNRIKGDTIFFKVVSNF